MECGYDGHTFEESRLIMSNEIMPIYVKISGDSDETLNELELTSIYALLAYTAHEHKISEETIRQIVTQHFGVEDVTKLPMTKYDEVIKFLVDIQVEMFMN